MILQEVFNTRRVVRWEHHGNIEVGHFEYDEKPYIIKIRSENVSDLEIAFVSFSSVDEAGVASEELTDHKKSFQVIGVVLNALLDKKIQDAFDVVVFSALNNVEARMSLYDRAADRVLGLFKGGKFRVQIQGGEATILITKKGAKKEHLSTEQLSKLAAEDKAGS